MDQNLKKNAAGTAVEWSETGEMLILNQGEKRQEPAYKPAPDGVEIMVGDLVLVWNDEQGQYLPDLVKTRANREGVKDGSSMETESISIEERVTRLPNGDIEVERRRTTVMVAVSDAEARLKYERLQLKIQAIQNLKYLGSLSAALVAGVLVTLTFSVCAGVWGARAIMGVAISEALGLVLKVGILGVSAYVAIWILCKTRFRAEETYSDSATRGAGAGAGAAGNGAATTNNTVINIGADFTGNTSAAQNHLNAR